MTLGMSTPYFGNRRHLFRFFLAPVCRFRVLGNMIVVLREVIDSPEQRRRFGRGYLLKPV